MTDKIHTERVMQGRINFIAEALELRLSCIKPSLYICWFQGPLSLTCMDKHLYPL